MSLPRPAPAVESDRTFLLRLAYEESLERDRIEAEYPADDDTAEWTDPTALPGADRESPDEDTGEYPPTDPDELPEDPACDGVHRFLAVGLTPIRGGAPEPSPSAEPTGEDWGDYSEWSAELDPGMAFPEPECPLADRRRWERQNRLAETWYRDSVD